MHAVLCVLVNIRQQCQFSPAALLAIVGGIPLSVNLPLDKLIPYRGSWHGL